MNKLLAEGVRFLNGIVAVLLIVIGAIGGRVGAAQSFGNPEGGMIIGGLLGFVVAVMLCGLLATFIEIRSELVSIRQALQRNDTAK